METSQSSSSKQSTSKKPPQGGTRPGGGAGDNPFGTQGNWGGPAGFGAVGNDFLTPARFWIQQNPAKTVVGAFATGVLLGMLQK